ncbi:MAG: hypothetical protein EA407_05430 [Rhodobacteraceae bacterium]|nr:MAG: hypothetical protein EA407_05430 [Paracoccaceae bacterium]
MTPVSQIGAATAVRPQAASSEPTITSDFQTFLRMLTVQLKNQNPLEPMEASDFAVQLATFSGVEQQVRTNELLALFTARQGLVEMGSWVGREALTSAPVQIDDMPKRLVLPEIPGADRADLVLSDGSGRVVGRFAVDPNARELVFEAPLEGEGALAPDAYKITVEGFRASEALGAFPVKSYARVEEARYEEGQVILILEGGNRIASDDVLGLRG